MATMRKVWTIAFGKRSHNWPRYHESGVARIGWPQVGDVSHYDSLAQVQKLLDSATDALACWQFCRDMNRGDELWVKRGRSELLGIGIVASDYAFDATDDDFPHMRRVDWKSRYDPPRSVKKNTLAAKTLTEVTHRNDLVEILRSETPPTPVYTLADAERDIFLSTREFRGVLALLRRKKNVILQGPPGTGKTYVARRLAGVLNVDNASDRVETVQFHQSYSYEDFVRGYRPTAEGGFRLEDGPFLRFCARANADSDSPYVLIIDEINRGDLSRVLGELFTLIEADKRNPEWAIRLAYPGGDNEQFHVPENVYLIGTLNTADRSIALVDYALRRRFAFVDVPPAFNTDGFRDAMRNGGVSEELCDRIVQKLSELNNQIGAHSQLGDGYQIGHSYFCAPPDTAHEEWYSLVIEHEIAPLLREYWFDDRERAEDEIKKLLQP